jgi:hypothetical protein
MAVTFLGTELNGSASDRVQRFERHARFRVVINRTLYSTFPVRHHDEHPVSRYLALMNIYMSDQSGCQMSKRLKM